MASTTIRDLGTQMAKWEQDRRQAEITASLGAELNPDNKTPFQNANEFLADQVKQIGEASAERARLTSEQAREEYDNQVRANIIKEKEHAENRKQEADLATAQNQQRNFAQAQAIAQQLNSIPIQPGENSYTMDNSKLAQIAKLTQEWNALRDRAPELELMFLDERVWEPGFTPQQTQAQPAPSITRTENGNLRLSGLKPKTFEDGSEYRTTNTDSGVRVESPYGVTFEGPMDEVIAKLAKSNVHSRAYADAWKSQYESLQSQPQTQQQQPDLGQQYSSISSYWTDQQADQIIGAISKKLEFGSTEEMVSHFKNLSQTGQLIEEQALASDFHMKHPEFPDTTAASEAIAGIIAANGWQWNLGSMEAANALAIQRGLYQPLTQEMIAAANGAPIQHTRPTPPPLAHGGNPEYGTQPYDPWGKDETAASTRARYFAMKAELERQ